MAKRPPPPPVEPEYDSDFSGEEIPIGQHVVVRMMYDGKMYVLDGHYEELREWLEKAPTVQNMPGRKRKTDGGTPNTSGETPPDNGEGDEGDNEGEGEGEDEGDGGPTPTSRRRKAPANA